MRSLLRLLSRPLTRSNFKRDMTTGGCGTQLRIYIYKQAGAIPACGCANGSKDCMSMIWFQSMEVFSHDLIPFSCRRQAGNGAR
ncbi:unnamed protein product [Urochloa humidicola]